MTSGNDDAQALALLQDRLLQATRECLERARPLLRSAGPAALSVDIRFDLRGLAAGQARLGADGLALIRYNLAIAKRQPEAFLARTVPHEVAHLVTYIRHRSAAPHGPEWRAVMRALGVADPTSTHAYDVTGLQQRQQRRWAYRCECGEHALSTTRHRRVLRRQMLYYCRKCGAELRPSENKA